MKIQLLFLLLGGSYFMTAQNLDLQAPASSVTFHPVSLPKTECISDAQRAEIWQEIDYNKPAILKKNPNVYEHRGAHPLFILPFKPKQGFSDYGYYSLFNQVDHNITPNGNLLDYNCGQRTYDQANSNHKGTDYVVWPYPWKKMDENVMEIIAAAAGTIEVKRDGNFDRGCENNGNNNWNGIQLIHADGSRTFYWHFKDGSLTSKEVGDTVEVGEFLGHAGSSGSSDIPHLHFEVYDASVSRIDPYAGPCNNLNADSWWIDQPDYFVPEILTLSTHNSDNFDSECGVAENTYEELNFENGETIRFRIFYRDLQLNSNTHITVRKPDNSILYEYDFDSPWPDYTAAWAQWNFPVDASWPTGVYTVSADFGGNSYETIFGVRTNLGLEDLTQNEIVLYPNPTSKTIFVEASSQIDKIQIFDLTGRKVLEIPSLGKKAELNLGYLTTGIYMAVISSEGKKAVKKIVKE
ncbi:T9SS type A sorting domain-containing protein [Aequorivita sp. SDUM287046]|uniref:T9SS type A sorting domain-containing protein n=1 Tax=Aequorivita aurantiaca TaxID=3053356 RepID=A0ABT8DDI5_9FLAO|nr:T9SS type A sorting domain-containing protein [Aequorivita aurantiaca]MDN3723302.1 T9SS type A sorting domain-containing protein [Aequorivita aurantiaca]